MWHERTSLLTQPFGCGKREGKGREKRKRKEKGMEFWSEKLSLLSRFHGDGSGKLRRGKKQSWSTL